MIVQSLPRSRLSERSAATLCTASRVEPGRVALPLCELLCDRRLGRSRLGAFASAGELLEIRHDAVLQDAGAGKGEKGDVLRGLSRPWCDPPGCAGSEFVRFGIETIQVDMALARRAAA